MVSIRLNLCLLTKFYSSQASLEVVEDSCMKVTMVVVAVMWWATSDEAMLTPPTSSCAATKYTHLLSLESPKWIEETKVSQPSSFPFMLSISISRYSSYPSHFSTAWAESTPHPVSNDLHDLKLPDGHEDILRCSRVLCRRRHVPHSSLDDEQPVCGRRVWDHPAQHELVERDVH